MGTENIVQTYLVNIWTVVKENREKLDKILAKLEEK